MNLHVTLIAILMGKVWRFNRIMPEEWFTGENTTDMNSIRKIDLLISLELELPRL